MKSSNKEGQLTRKGNKMMYRVTSCIAGARAVIASVAKQSREFATHYLSTFFTAKNAKETQRAQSSYGLAALRSYGFQKGNPGNLLKIMVLTIFLSAATIYAQPCAPITSVSISSPDAKATIIIKKMDYCGAWKTPADASATFTATASGGDLATAYEWFVDGELQSGETTATFVFNPPVGVEGAYSVYAAAVNACTKSNTARSQEMMVFTTKGTRPPTFEVDPPNHIFRCDEMGSSSAQSFTVNVSDGWTYDVSGDNANHFTVTRSGNILTVWPNDINFRDIVLTATITVTACGMTETVNITHSIYTYTLPPNPYVGAFWRWDERGERIIRFTNITGANTGDWKAEVIWMDNKWNSGDIVLDTDSLSTTALNSRGITWNAGTENPQSAETFFLPGAATIASGNVPPGSGQIIFRIGLKSNFTTYNPSTNPARYALIQLTYGTPEKIQFLFIRQGEGADIISEATTPFNYTNVKWNPYNVGNYNNPNEYGTGSNRLVDFPTKSGYYYQWNNATTAYHPSIPNSGPYPGWNTSVSGNLPNLCPTGFKVPTPGYNNTQLITVYGEADALWAIDVNNVNGYYADGFFDRRARTSTAQGAIPAEKAVSYNNANIAYAGIMFFNITTRASIFFPTGNNFRMSDGSLVDNSYYAYILYYWSSISQDPNGQFLNFAHAGWKDFGCRIRCIAQY